MRESMSPQERIDCVLRLQRCDRTPVVPLLSGEAAAALSGFSMAEVAADDALARRAVFTTFDEYGGWDGVYPACETPEQLQALGIYPMRIAVPGRELPANACFEVEEACNLGPEDYEKIAAEGFEAFYHGEYLARVAGAGGDGLPALLSAARAGNRAFEKGCAERGVGAFFSVAALHPFFCLALMRSMACFGEDLLAVPEAVERALSRMTDDLIESAITETKENRGSAWMLTEERASGFFFPLELSRRFWWPYTRRMVDALWSEGILTILHLDHCWDKNLDEFRSLPRASVLLELDGATDIFKAKDALRGHVCLHGDVPAALLAQAPPEEVELYCRRLIDTVAQDGGFILGSGCSVPAQVRPENFRTMIDIVKNYRAASSSRKRKWFWSNK